MNAACKKDTARKLMGFHDAMYSAFGPQGWWPGKTRFEVIVGAILTQNTAWTNVEKAIKNLRSKGLLNPGKMHGLKPGELAAHIKPAGYFNIKARRLKNFLDHLFDNYDGSIDRFLSAKRSSNLRAELLGINGIGPETADSIALYAASLPEFVADAYTKRVFSRHGLLKEDADYDETKSLFMENLPSEVRLFNEYHALIVKTGKDFCRPREPRCQLCPLKSFL
jgi:endonuclease III related protein